MIHEIFLKVLNFIPMKIYVPGIMIFEHEKQRWALTYHRICVINDSFVMDLHFTLSAINHNFIEQTYLKLEVEKQSLLLYYFLSCNYQCH